MAFGIKNIFKPIQDFFSGGGNKKPKPSSSSSNAALLAAQQAQQAQAVAAADEAKRKADAAAARAALEAKKGRNEAEVSQRNTEQFRKASEDSQETAVNKDEQREREKMVRTFAAKKRGRASLRINLGSNSGSSYEGSSGISISL